MTKSSPAPKGFTIVELLIACVVIAILAVLSVVLYQGVQQRAANAAIFKDLKGASEHLGLEYVRSPKDFSNLSELPEDFHPSKDVETRLVFGYGGDVYTNLSPVQNGVLFHQVCEELMTNPLYLTIHAREGTDTNNVLMSCSDSTSASQMQITGWQTEPWQTPVTREKIQDFMDNKVTYDPWWTDKQEVVRSFYRELMNRFEAKGGTFPITSFWDFWANQWSGVHKEELPPPTPRPSGSKGAYCVEAYHRNHPETIYKITQDDKIVEGSC